LKIAHLRDALDHWKGSLIDVIGDEGLNVVPMLTDRNEWTQEHFETYARLLCRKPENVLKKERGDLFSNRTRHGYFCNMDEGDLFLDPDTGIAPDEKAEKEHINLSEIVSLLPAPSSRMLLIYQHASREKDGPRKKLQLLRDTQGLRECGIFAYDSGMVSMIGISRNRDRTDKASARLKIWLGPVASTRIIA